MGKLNKKVVILFFLILGGLYLVIGVFPSIFGSLTRTDTIEHGTLEIASDVKCYIARDETVYLASDTGKVDHYIEEGTQTKAGTLVLEIEHQSSEKKEDEESKYKTVLSQLGDKGESAEDNVSKRKGVLTYYVDGYEELFDPESLEDLTFAKANGLGDNMINVENKEVEKGDPLFKICDNSNWYMAFWIEKGDISKYEIGEEVNAILPKGEVEATVSQIYEQGNKWLIVLQTNRFYENFTKERIVEATIRTVDREGLIIENGCLTTKGDQVGVYTKQTTGEYIFVPVQVIISDGENSLVKENFFYDDKGEMVDTVKVYDQVLTHPKSQK